MPVTVIIAVVLDIVAFILSAGFTCILLLFVAAFPGSDSRLLLWVIPVVALSTLVFVGVLRRWAATRWCAAALALAPAFVPGQWHLSGLLFISLPVVAAILLWLPASARWFDSRTTVDTTSEVSPRHPG